jgi:hypothetical protein
VLKIVSLLLLSVAIYSACYNKASSLVAVRQESTSTIKPEDLCNRIAEIKKLPFKEGEKVDDEVYNGLIALGDSSIPCLIDKLTDTTKMKDPRKAPTYESLTVGDTAHFVLVDKTNLGFEEMLPDEVKKKAKEDGVYAYFKFVEQETNRRTLQNNWLSWYQKKYGQVHESK